MVELDEISKRAIANMRRDMAEDIKRDVEMFRKLKMTDDDPDKMLAESWMYYAVFWIVILILAFLSGCTPTATVQHEVPLLQGASDSIRKTSDSIRNAVDKMASAPMQCQTLEMPPIPRECVIDIRGDTYVASSRECDSLLRYYARARRLLKPAAPTYFKPTPKP